MSDADGLLLLLSIMPVVTSVGAITRPGILAKESQGNRDSRLRGLDAGAPEAFFEERRQLESYTPRFDLSHRPLRMIGLPGLAFGVSATFAVLAR